MKKSAVRNSPSNRNPIKPAIIEIISVLVPVQIVHIKTPTRRNFPTRNRKIPFTLPPFSFPSMIRFCALILMKYAQPLKFSTARITAMATLFGAINPGKLFAALVDRVWKKYATATTIAPATTKSRSATRIVTGSLSLSFDLLLINRHSLIFFRSNF